MSFSVKVKMNHVVLRNIHCWTVLDGASLSVMVLYLWGKPSWTPNTDLALISDLYIT